MASSPHILRAASPFARLARLLEGVEPGKPAIDLALGEPRHPMPDFVSRILAQNAADYARYPVARGTAQFRRAVANWLEARFGLDPLDPERQVIALNGSREGLFTASMVAARMKGVERPAILVPNPYYQAYGAAGPLVGADIVPMPASAETGFLPDPAALDAALLARTACAFIASPANPQGAVGAPAYFERWIELAHRHGFLLFSDECYSEIYRREAPAGALEAAERMGAGFSRVVAFNSISKRSNLPGLRVGFAAGDPDFLDAFMALRDVAGPQVPLPAQAVAAAALADEAHVAASRDLYRAKFDLAEAILGIEAPAGGFFLWLDVSAKGGDEAACLSLWRDEGVRVVPGGYLGREGADGVNPGKGYIRVALVADTDTTREALGRIKTVTE